MPIFTPLAILSLLFPLLANAGDRGLVYEDSTLASLFSPYPRITWGYDWAYPSHNLYAPLEFVPMLYGNPTGNTGWQDEWRAAVSTARDSGTTHLLAFNEPDIWADNNYIAPSDAAAAYRDFVQPYAGEFKLGAPAVTNGGPPTGFTWLGEFLGNCTGCTVDFVPVHWYAGATQIEYFREYVQQAFVAGGERPVWITEFQGEGSEEEQVAFVRDVVPWLDQQAFVERYAYFGVFKGYLINEDGTGLSDLGKAYAES